MTFEKLAYTVKGLEIAEKKAVTVDALIKVLKEQQKLLVELNNAFETGFFVGTNYEFLWSCKHDLVSIQRRVNEKALNIYNAGNEKAELAYMEV